MSAERRVIEQFDETTADLPRDLALNLDAHFERLVRCYQDRIYAFCLRYTGSPEDAEEIAQDAFVSAYRALRAYPSERIQALALRSWLYQIALNGCRNRARGKHLRLVQMHGDDDGHPEIEPEADERERPDVVHDRYEGTREMGVLVAKLPERYRAAIVLRHIDGMGYAEAAGVLGEPVGTVKSNVHRGVQMLREAIDRTANEGSIQG